jgi:hypothetical protein
VSKAQKIILTIAIVGYVLTLAFVGLGLSMVMSSPHSAYELAQRNGCRHILANGDCRLTNRTTVSPVVVEPEQLPAYGFGSETSYYPTPNVKGVINVLFATTAFFIALFAPLYFIWGSKKRQASHS